MNDEKRLRPEGEDVEAHELRDRPGADRPGYEGQSEDVEAHSLTDRPDFEANSEEPDVEAHSLTERPAGE